MNRIVKLNEQQISRIVRKVLNEDINNNSLHSDLKKVLVNSNASKEEKIDVLKNIIDDMESSEKMRRFAIKKNRDPDLKVNFDNLKRGGSVKSKTKTKK